MPTDYPEAKLYLIYCGTQARYFHGVTVLPFTEAVQKLPELLSSDKDEPLI